MTTNKQAPKPQNILDLLQGIDPVALQAFIAQGQTTNEPGKVVTTYKNPVKRLENASRDWVEFYPNVWVKAENTMLLFRIDTSRELYTTYKKDKAGVTIEPRIPMNQMIGNTGGWHDVPGTDIRVNLGVMIDVESAGTGLKDR